VTRIEPLTDHDRAAFSSGVPALDRFLREQAGQEQRRQTTRCYVLCEGSRILGYYTLSAAALARTALPDAVTKRLPRYQSIGAILLGRLAVDLRYRRQGWGAVLLADALLRTRQTQQLVGVFALIVDAKDASAAAFYEYHGFQRLLDDPARLFLAI
jgi:GNAT superfamily N-acetyltransferase